MTRAQRIEADCLFWLTAGNGSGWREVWIESARYWIPTLDRREFDRKLSAIRVLGDGEISLVPRLGQDCYFTTSSSCLWARVESRHGAKLLADFKPEPTLVLRDGDTVKRTAFWWLDNPLDPIWALKANERLSQALGGIRKHAALDEHLVPPQASRGVQEIHLEAIRLRIYHPNQVVGSDRPDRRALKDAPDLQALREKHRQRREEAVAA